MAGTVIGDAAVRITADASGFGRDVENQTRGALARASSGIGQAVKRGLQGGAIAVAEFARESVKDFSEAEQAETRFNFAISRFPKLADVSRASLEALAGALAEKTKFSRVDVQTTESQLAAFNLTGKQLQALTPLVADYAARTGKDLPEAATAVGRALLGNTRALKEIGINIKPSTDAAVQFSNVFGALREKVGGFAEREGKTAAGQAKILAHQFEEVKIQVGAALTPVLLGLLTAIKPLLPVFGKLVTSLAKAVAPILTVFAKALDDLLPALLPVVQTIGGALLGVVKALLPALVPVIVAIAQALVPSLKILSPFLVQIAQLFAQLLLALVPILPPLLALLPPLLQLAIAIAGPLLQALTAILPPLVTLVVQGITPLLNILGVVVRFVTGVLTPVFRTIRDFLVTSFHGAIALVTHAFSGFFDAAFRTWAFIQRIPGDIVVIAKKIFDFFAGLPGRIASIIAGAARSIFSVGADIARGFFEGITHTIGRLASHLPGFLKDRIPDNIKRFFDIHSPSRVMYKIGAQVGEGFNLGLLDSLGRSASTQALSRLLSPLDLGAASGAAAIAAPIQVVQNITTTQPDPRVLANEVAFRLQREATR